MITAKGDTRLENANISASTESHEIPIRLVLLMRVDRAGHRGINRRNLFTDTFSRRRDTGGSVEFAIEDLEKRGLIETVDR